MDFNIVGKRKYSLALLVVLLNTALCAFGRIDGTVYSAVTLAVVGAYLVANVAAQGKAASA